MKRKTYWPLELRAGHTFFVGRIDMRSWPPRAAVDAYLVTSRRERMPAEGEILPYRLNPEMLAYIGHLDPLFRKRRDAQRWIDRVQASVVARLGNSWPDG